jgi:RNA polymerase sigma-70 factor (ECF subfamily)
MTILAASSSRAEAPATDAQPVAGVGAMRPGEISAAPTATATTDAALVTQSRAGDREAFGELVRRHENAVFRLAWRMLRVREDAEDVTQETFLRAWRSLDRFDVAREFRPWLLRITLNTAATESRRRGGRSATREDAMPNPETLADVRERSPAESLARKEELAAVGHVVERLPAESAALFQLRYGEHLPVKDIARILGRKPNAITVALHRLRARLREALSGKTEEIR